ncbi:alcohol oxidase [Artomyces pyxidatus]|uniref:Alcohol oxidase n=1 Tax=Artomyces pyxidatus TaxID=48021 RepID=A0ACB8SLM5_9AGAM|nr:alcohol oxidase [Artomyces pyxidatus]
MPIAETSDFLKTNFDYLVIGGGTSGLVVAARLSEDPNAMVGVIEAGEYHRDAPEVNVPGLAGRGMMNPMFDWNFVSEPQEYVNNRVIAQPRGKGLGGSSLLNLLCMARASKVDFNALEALGNKGWNWDSLLEYSKRSETFVPLNDEALAAVYGVVPDLDYHGIDGPIIESFSPWYSPLQAPVSEAIHALGVPRNGEPANGNNVGVNTGVSAIDPRTSTRSYAASGYYEPNASRKNLIVLTGAQVTKIILEKTSDGLQRAVGVDFIKGERKFEKRGVRKEVIISAGTFQTPALLELSGVGNPKLLNDLGIPLIIDLPGVGENLQDHPCSYVIFEVDSKFESLDCLVDSPEFLAKHMELYKHRAGIMASQACQSFAYVPAPAVVSAEKIQKWQDAMTTDATSLPPSLTKQYDIIRPWIADSNQAHFELLGLPCHYFGTTLSAPQPGKRYYSFVVALLHPLARGSVHVRSADATAAPAIDPNLLGHPLDLAMLTDVLRFALRVFETEPMRSATVGPILPAPVADLEEYVRQTAISVWHPLGTAAMLPRSEGGVVDAELMVYGTSNLRIVSTLGLCMS